MSCVDERRDYFLAKAKENFPKMYYKEVKPVADIEVFGRGTSILLDLGNHYVGHFSFEFDNFDDYISAPIHLQIKFGEDMREINDDFSTYRGRLSYTWLQEESLFVDCPGKVSMPRRYACRYIKITVKETRRKIKLWDFCFTASTSADETKLKPADISDPLLKKIDAVAVNTLKECMQTFFEDGPKRDRRLWTGDLRLEALANYYTFDNRETVKRSLYLLAAGEVDELGFLPSYIYETPYYFAGRDHIADYAMLFVTSVCDYFAHTDDRETLDDLLTLCKEQMDSFYNILDENGIVTPHGGWFLFIDWCQGLKGLTALMGVYLYALEKFTELLKNIGDSDASKYEKRLSDGRAASKKHLFDMEKGMFVNALDSYQVSVHSQVWMILGGVVSGEEGRKALTLSLSDTDAKQPFTPYMRHYVIEAMMKLRMLDEAVAHIKEIWGGMIERGADTFFEAYVKDEPDFSPYGDRMINSLCHAWSCTPTYFIRKYLI